MSEPGSPRRDPRDHEPPPDGSGGADFDDVLNHVSFGGGGRRKRRHHDVEAERPESFPQYHNEDPASPPESQPQPQQPQQQPRRRPGAARPEPPGYPDPYAQPATPPRVARSVPPPSLPPMAQEISWPETGVAPLDPIEPDDSQDAPAIVRAYAWTRGRTTSQYKLEIETLLTTSDRYQPGDEWMQAEYHSIASLCYQPRSVAEVAALLSLPLGVAKVLLGDMAGQGLLVVHEVAASDGQGPDLMLMERILSGLRRL